MSQILVGTTGFGPATSRPPAERATKLRHVPRALFRKKYTGKSLPYLCKPYLLAGKFRVITSNLDVGAGRCGCWTAQ